jgi:teichuronic acid biosynthesis glycosyltransferase TuaC
MMTAPIRLKVLVVSHLYPYEALGVGDGNLGTFVRDQVKALQKFCDLRLVIPCDCFPRQEHYQPSGLRKWWSHILALPKKLDDEGIPLDFVRFAALPPRRHFLFGYGAAAFLPVLTRVRALRREFPFDIIHAHTTIPDGMIAIWLARVFGVRAVITSHQGDVELVPQNRWNRATLRYTLSRADRIVAVSKSLKRAITSLDVGSDRIRVIPNGFDPAKFSVASNQISEIRRSRSEKIVLFLGQLVSRKNPTILLRAIARLRKRLPQVRLILVGDGLLRAELETEVVRLGLKTCVDVIGAVPHAKVPDYVRAADLLCLPSRAEGWPTVIFEALSQGVPVVASRVGGIPEAICSEDFGLLVESGNLNDLTEALYQGLTRVWDDVKIRTYAREFTWDKIAMKLQSEYQLVAQQKSCRENLSPIVRITN